MGTLHGTVEEQNARLKKERQQIETYLLELKVPPAICKAVARLHMIGGPLTKLILVG